MPMTKSQEDDKMALNQMIHKPLEINQDGTTMMNYNLENGDLNS